MRLARRLCALLLLLAPSLAWADTHTFSGTGSWTETARWDQSNTLPANGDSAIIASGAVCTLDDDLITDTVTLVDLTITGTLTCATTGGPYSLSVSGHIQGAGTFNAGSSGTALPVATVLTINLGAAGHFLGTSGLVINFYCAQPTNAFVKTTATEVTQNTTLVVDTDLTSAGNVAHWSHSKYLAICDVNKALDYKGPGATGAAAPLTIHSSTDIDSTTITLSGNHQALDAAGAYVILCSRNIDIVIGTSEGGTSSSANVFDTFTNAVLGCSIRQMGTTQAGRGVSTGTGCTTSGTISGCTSGVYSSSGHTISGTISGCIAGTQAGTGHTISGTISGCTNGVYYGSGHTISGTVSGCANGVYMGTGHMVSGTVSGCGTGVYYGSGHTISGTVSGCSYGVNYGSGHTISGTISGCGSGVMYGSVQLTRGAKIETNTRDVYNVSGEGYTLLVGRGAALGSDTQINVWKNSSVPSSRYDIGTFLYDLASSSGGTPQIGWVKCWMPGGQVYSLVNTDAPSTGRPTVPDNFFHYVEGQDSTAPVFLDEPIFGHKDVPLNFSVHFYDVNDSGAWSVAPQFQIIDPDYAFNAGGAAILAHSHPTGTEDAWEVVTLTYTPTQDRQLILRFIGTANSTSTAHACWFRCLTVAPTWPDVANVWYGTGGFGPLNTTYTPAMRASNIDVTGGAAAHLTAPDVKSGVTVDNVEGSATGGGSVIIIED